MDIVEALSQIQRERHMTHATFAAHLGISRVHWIRIKNRHMQAGDRVRLGALRTFGVAVEGGELVYRQPVRPIPDGPDGEAPPLAPSREAPC